MVCTIIKNKCKIKKIFWNKINFDWIFIWFFYKCWWTYLEYLFEMKKKYALTLIEILVAILVFSIWILAVLRVIMWNISVMDYTNSKLQSTILAKEWIELLYNVRDSNLEKNLSWNCVMSPYVFNWSEDELSYSINNPNMNSSSSFESVICSDHFSFSKLLQLSFNKEFYIIQNTIPKITDFDELFEKNKLCLYKDVSKNLSWYAYCKDEEWWEETFFARYLSFTWVKISESSNVLPENKILKVESHVLFKKWWKTWDVVFESFIWNY